jgi:transposase
VEWRGADGKLKREVRHYDTKRKSVRAAIRAMIEGETNPEVLANLARRRMRGKIPELPAALDGRLDERYRFPMRQHWDLLETLEKRVEKLEREIGQRVIPFEWGCGCR